MPQLSAVIPKSDPKPRTFDNTKPNPNAVVLQTHGPRQARITKFSKVFYEKNVGSSEKPSYVPARADDPAAIARIRVSVEFKKLKNPSNEPLVLSMKMTASLYEKANFAKLIAGIMGIAPADVEKANPDTDSFIGADVLATTKAGRDNVAILSRIEPPPRIIDEDEDEVPQAAAPVAAAPAAAIEDDAPLEDEDPDFD